MHEKFIRTKIDRKTLFARLIYIKNISLSGKSKGMYLKNISLNGKSKVFLWTENPKVMYLKNISLNGKSKGMYLKNNLVMSLSMN